MLFIICFCPVPKSFPTPCNPKDYSTPGLPVTYYLPEFAQVHVHWVSDAIQLILWHPLFLLPAISPSIRVFSNESAFCIRRPSIGHITTTVPCIWAMDMCIDCLQHKENGEPELSILLSLCAMPHSLRIFLNLHPQQWNCSILTTGPPGNSSH